MARKTLTFYWLLHPVKWRCNFRMSPNFRRLVVAQSWSGQSVIVSLIGGERCSSIHLSEHLLMHMFMYIFFLQRKTHIKFCAHLSPLHTKLSVATWKRQISGFMHIKTTCYRVLQKNWVFSPIKCTPSPWCRSQDSNSSSQEISVYSHYHWLDFFW